MACRNQLASAPPPATRLPHIGFRPFFQSATSGCQSTRARRGRRSCPQQGGATTDASKLVSQSRLLGGCGLRQCLRSGGRRAPTFDSSACAASSRTSDRQLAVNFYEGGSARLRRSLRAKARRSVRHVRERPDGTIRGGAVGSAVVQPRALCHFPSAEVPQVMTPSLAHWQVRLSRQSECRGTPHAGRDPRPIDRIAGPIDSPFLCPAANQSPWRKTQSTQM